MPDPALSQAIKEAYAAAPSDVVILHTLELRHPAFVDDAGEPTAIRVVRDHADLTARLEPGAPLDGGAMVTFIAMAFDLSQPPVDRMRSDRSRSQAPPPTRKGRRWTRRSPWC